MENFSRTKYEKFILTSNTTHVTFEKKFKKSRTKKTVIKFFI